MLLPLILGGASALASAWGANRAANAQEQAAEAQLALQREVYGDQRYLLHDYREAGENALASYGNMLDRGWNPVARPGQVNVPHIRGPGREEGFDYRDPRRVTGPNMERFAREFRTTPGYEFQVQEGQRAVEGSAAAQGGLLSGATLGALQDRRQGIADQTWDRERDAYVDNYWRRTGANQANYWADRTADTDNYWRGRSVNDANYWAGAQMNNANRWAEIGQNRQDLWQTRAFNEDRRNQYWDRQLGMIGVGQSAAAGTAAAAGNMGAAGSNALGSIGDARAAGWMGATNAINNGVQNALGMYAYYNPPQYGQSAAQPGMTSSPIPPSRPW